MTHCPVKQLIHKIIYDITILIYIRQWFSKRDFDKLLNDVRSGTLTKGHHIVICGICGIQ